MPLDASAAELAGLVGNRARNLFVTRQLLCSEAVLVTLSRGLRGGLDEETAVRMASAFAEGLGGGGCLCGALAGGVLALGLFLGRSRPGGRDRGRALPASKELHDRFRERFGATCCRVLSKSIKKDHKRHFEQCSGLAGEAAAMAAEILLDRRPELLNRADRAYLSLSDSSAGATLKRLAEYMRPR